MAINSFQGANSYGGGSSLSAPKAVNSNISVDPTKIEDYLGSLNPLVSDLISVGAPNSYVKKRATFDPAKVQSRLDEYQFYDPASFTGALAPLASQSAANYKGQLAFKPGSIQSYIDQYNANQAARYAAPSAVGGAPGSDLTYGLPSGYTQRDAGIGKYEMLDPSGNVVGTGYKSLRDTYNDYVRGDAKGMVYSYATPERYEDIYADPSGESNTFDKGPVIGTKYIPGEQGWQTSFGDKFQTQQEAEEKAYNILNSFDYAKTDLERWELLGRYLNPDPNAKGTGLDAAMRQQWGDKTYGFGHIGDRGNIYERAQPHGYIGTGGTERITGENTLYGSTPVFQNGKLIGYKSTFAEDPMTETWDDSNSKKAGFFKGGYQFVDRGNAGIGQVRDDAQTQWLKDNAKTLGGRDYFIPSSVAASNPGWQNVDYQNRDLGYNQTSSTLTGTVLPAASMIALGAMSGGAAAGIGAGLGLGTIGAGIAGGIGGAVPGAIRTGATTGDWGKALQGVGIGALSGGLGAGISDLGVGQYLGDITGLGTNFGNAAIKGGLSALGSKLGGNSWGDALQSGLISGAGSFAGSQLGDLTSGVPGGKMLANVGSSALQNYLKQNSRRPRVRG